jgi:peptide-methionine (S)-S-oxide reductase
MLRSLAAPLALVAAVTLVAPAHSEPTFGPQSPATAVFAGGCFWGIEGVFEHLKGVTSATAGYAGGSVASPTYEQVSTGTTGHAEAVRVTYDPSQITYEQLLEVFFTVAHDPTQLNRQGPDHGTQYRSIVFYGDTAQQGVVQAYVGELMSKGRFAKPIVTQIVPLTAFYEAEEYHQNYMARHPRAMYIVYNDAPKVANLKRQFPALYREPIP